MKALEKLYKVFYILVLKPLQVVKNFIFVDLKKSLVNFINHDGELTICALAFYLLISFIPASLIFISIMSFFYQSDGMVYTYLNQIQTQLPSINIERITRIIDSIVKSKKYMSYIWIPFLFWWGSFIFDIIEQSLEKAFQIEKSRKYWKAKIRHFLIILLIGIVLIIVTFLSNFLAIVKNSDILQFITKYLGVLPFLKENLLSLGRIPYLLSSFAALVVNTVLIFIIYRFVPPKKLNNMSLLKGALFASMSYEIVKYIFSYYISEINDYTSIFGPLNSIVILIIWIWYTCFIFVEGAELAWVFYEKSEASKELNFDPPPFSSDKETNGETLNA